MDLWKQFKTDEQAEVEGVWVPLSATARVKLARVGNPRYQSCLKRLSLPYIKPGMRMSDIPEETYQAITKEAVAEAILVDWDGVIREGEVVAYSKEMALSALQMKDFFELVLAAANSMETYREARLRDMEKN